jgi:hypothetical protein
MTDREPLTPDERAELEHYRAAWPLVPQRIQTKITDHLKKCYAEAAEAIRHNAELMDGLRAEFNRHTNTTTGPGPTAPTKPKPHTFNEQGAWICGTCHAGNQNGTKGETCHQCGRARGKAW